MVIVRMLGVHQPKQRLIASIRPSVYVRAGTLCACAVGGRESQGRHVDGATAATAAHPVSVLPAYA